MFNDLAVLAFVLLLTLWLAAAAGPIVWTAVRTGRLLARGTVYHRDDHPALFYGGLLFWLGMLVVMLVLSVLLIIKLVVAFKQY